MMKDDIVLQVYELKKYFGEVRAVDGISFSVKRGQVYGFLGPNGSGKTTTICLILGLIYPTSGQIHVFGKRTTPLQNKHLNRVGSLVGSPALFPYLTAKQNLDLYTHLYPEIPCQRSSEILRRVGLAKVSHRRIRGFSTGMKQRLGIAISLLHRPELLILDEPTNGLDPEGMFDIRNLMAMLSEKGVTIFISSHLLHEVEQLCDRVAVLKNGRIIAEGDIATLVGEQKTVKVKVHSPQKAAQLLRQLPNCRDLQSNGTYLTLSGLPSEHIVSHLVSNGIIPTEVKRENLDLEHIYLQLTNGGSREVNDVLEPIVD